LLILAVFEVLPHGSPFFNVESNLKQVVRQTKKCETPWR